MAYQPAVNNTVSEGNSSTTALDNGESFTGEWEDVSSYDSVVVAVKTDQDGYFQIQFSPDGSNADSTLTRYYRTANIEPPHRFTITRQYARVVFYNNSGSNQSYMRLQTTFGDKTELNAPLDSALAPDFDAIATRPTGFTEEVALGRRQGMTTWNKFGFNQDVDSAATEVVASWGGAFQYLTSGETLTIASTSSDDDGDPAGDGARQLIIWGVDENWEIQIEIVTLNGTTNVVTASQWIGINRVSIYAAGDNQANAGTINVTATTSGYQIAQIPTGLGTTEQAIFYVPANHQFLASWLYLNAIKSSGGGSPEITFTGIVYSAISNAKYEIFQDSFDTGIVEHVELNPAEPFVIGEKSILWFNAATSSNDTSVRARFSGKLVRDVDA